MDCQEYFYNDARQQFCCLIPHLGVELRVSCGEWGGEQRVAGDAPEFPNLEILNFKTLHLNLPSNL